MIAASVAVGTVDAVIMMLQEVKTTTADSPECFHTDKTTYMDPASAHSIMDVEHLEGCGSQRGPIRMAIGPRGHHCSHIPFELIRSGETVNDISTRVLKSS